MKQCPTIIPAKKKKPKHRCPRRATTRAQDDRRLYCAQHAAMNHTWRLKP